MQELVATYELTVLSLIALSIIVLVQSFCGAIFGLVLGPSVPGETPQGDHNNFGHRALRTYMNSVENLPAFAVAAVAAMAVGADPWTVNTLSAAYVGSRILYWLVYYGNIGAHAGGPRTLLYVTGMTLNMALAIVALLAVVS